MVKRFLSISFLWVLHSINAQDTIQYTDTIPIVTVTAYSPLSERTAYHIDHTISGSSTYDLGDVLQHNSPVSINSYGANGAIATISMRGTNDDHNVVLWNGVRINNPSSGTADISLLSIATADKILVIPSAQGTYVGSGSFGGIIDLRQNLRFCDSNALSLSSNIAQFHQYQSIGNYLYSNHKVYFKSSGWWQKSINDYFYIDKYNEDKKTKSTHNGLKNHGFVADFAYKGDRNRIIRSGIWYENKNKETPTLMGGGQLSNKAQQDKVVRSFFNINYSHRHWNHSMLLGYTYDYLHYTDKFYPTDNFFSINSKIKVHRIQNTWESHKTLLQYLQLKIGYRYEYHHVSTNNYEFVVQRHQASAWASIYGNYRQWQYNLSVRQQLYDIGFYRPISSIEISWKTHRNSLFYLQYADKYRLPDYNELYWSPGGNRNLRAEKGNSIELGHIYPFSKKYHSLQIKGNCYFLSIRDNIQWIPVTSIIWSPKNIKNTHHIGADITIDHIYTKGKQSLSTTMSYNLNFSTMAKNTTYPQLEGNILRYRPKHQFKTTMNYCYSIFFCRLYFQYISMRYTDDENNFYFGLPSYPYLDFDIGVNILCKKVSTTFNFYIKNLTNTRYEVIRAYAMPPIHVGLQFLLHINTKK